MKRDGDIAGWLAALGLEQYAPAFAENEIDLDVLPDLTAADLTEIGVLAVGHRRKILARAAETSGTLPAVPVRAAAQPVEPDRSEVTERRVFTVMFCDIVGSTNMAARSDAEDFRDFIHDFRREIETVIQPFGGTVTQYLGDGIMANFGYPVASGHDAERAAAAGLAVLDRASRMPSFSGTQPQIRIGLATGTTVVRAKGDGLTDESAIGDTPNLASRLQGEAAPGTMVVSAATHALLGGLFDSRDLGEREIKGIPGVQRIWQVLGTSRSASRFEAQNSMRRDDLFVGRESELDLLRQRLRAAGDGLEAVTVIAGDAGMGKSTLAHRFLSQELSAPARFVVLQCTPINSGNALFPLQYFVAQSAGLVAADDGEGARRKIGLWLTKLGLGGVENVAAIGHLIVLASAGKDVLETQTPSQVRNLTLALLAKILECEIGPGGVLLVEDAQWIDPSSAELVRRLAPTLRGAKAMLLVTTEENGLPDWLTLDDNVSGARAEPIALDRLSDPEISILVSSLADGAEIGRSALTEISERSDGVPIFVEELTRGYLDSRHGESSDIGAVPLSVAESFVARLDRLAFGRRIAPVAAAIGRQFPMAVLVEVSTLPADQVYRGIAEMHAAGITEPTSGRFGPSIRFRHYLVREAAYGMLLRRARADLHTRISAVVTEQFPEIARLNPQLLAMQNEAAGNHDLACAQWSRAGAIATTSTAYAEAEGAYRRAIGTLLRTEPSRARDERELDLRINLSSAEICSVGFHTLNQSENQERIVTLSKSIGDTASLTRSLHMEWVRLLTNFQFSDCRDLVLQALAGLEDLAESDRLILLRMCATALLFCGQLEDALAKYFEFMDIYDPDVHAEKMRGTHSDHAAMIVLGIGEVYTLMGDPAAAQRWCQRSIAMAKATGRRHDQCHTLTFAGCLHPYLNGDYAAVAANAKEMAAIMVEESLPNWAGFPVLFSGLAAFHTGERELGLTQARQGMGHFLKTASYEDWPHLLVAEICLDAHLWDEASQWLDAAHGAMKDSESRFAAEFYRLKAGLLFGRDNDGKAARECLASAVHISRRQGAHLFERRARSDLETLFA